MTELEPFSWTRSKFAKIHEFLEIAIFGVCVGGIIYSGIVVVVGL